LLDLAPLINPLREFGLLSVAYFPLPPFYHRGLEELAAAGVIFTLPPERLAGIARCWWATRAISGHIIECGSYRGATSLLIAVLGKLNDLTQKVFVCDTFGGLPEATHFDVTRKRTEFSLPPDQIERILRQAESAGLAARIQIRQGPFASTLRTSDMCGLQFAMSHIDCNLFQSTHDACSYVVPRMSKGGIVVFDDYNGVCDLGARLAVDYYFATTNRRLTMTSISGPSVFTVVA